jgi:hypothetical protein
MDSGNPTRKRGTRARGRGAEIERLHAVIPKLIHCAQGDPATCARDQHGWYPCCRARLVAVSEGLLPSTAG